MCCEGSLCHGWLKLTSGRSFTWNFYSKAGLEARQGDDSFPRGSLGRVVAGVCHRSLGCCQHPPLESAPMGALAVMAGSIWGLPSLASPGKAGWGSCSTAQRSSGSRILPVLLSGSPCLFFHGYRGIQCVAGPSFELCLMQSLLAKCSGVSPLRERPQGPGTLNRAEHPSGCLTALDPALDPASACCQGAPPHPWGPPLIHQEQGQEKGCKLRAPRPCEVSAFLRQAPTLHMAGVK